MKIARSIRISQKQLLAHKLRTILALAGIILGVSTVIVMVAIGNGAREEVLARIDAMGTNLIIVNAGQIQKQAGRQEIRGTVTTLRLEDAAAIERDSPLVAAAVPMQSKKIQVKYDNVSTNTTVIGTLPGYTQVRNTRVISGSFFSEEENQASRRVAVIGQSVLGNLFSGQNAIGETIRIGRIPFEIIGVLEPKGLDMNGVDQDDQILIPIRTALRRVFNLSYISAISVQARDSRVMTEAAEQVRKILREEHHLDRKGKPDDFTIQSQTDILNAQKETADTFTLLIGSIAGISLLIGGIGILAIMLIAIRERTQEIGLRMALGARRKGIMTQFIMEASMLSLGGGLLGILIGLLGALTLRSATSWAISVSSGSIGLSFGFSLLVGLFFGIYPARRASRLDPITALRSE